MKHLNPLILSLLLSSLPLLAQQPPTKTEAKPTTFELSEAGKKSLAEIAQIEQEQRASEAELHALVEKLAEVQRRQALLQKARDLMVRELESGEQAKTCGDCTLQNVGGKVVMVKPPTIPPEPKTKGAK